MAITMHSHVAEKSSKPTAEDAYTALRQQQQEDETVADSDLLTRTSWTDARLALHQIKKVRYLIELLNRRHHIGGTGIVASARVSEREREKDRRAEKDGRTE